MNEEKRFKCQNCPFQTKYKDSLLKHTLVHLKPKILKCPQCSFHATTPYGLERHLLNDHKDKNKAETVYNCGYCSYQTTVEDRLTMHKLSSQKCRRLHKSDKEMTYYNCQQCSFKTKYKSNVQIHVQKVHKKNNDSEEVDNCNYCSSVKHLR